MEFSYGSVEPDPVPRRPPEAILRRLQEHAIIQRFAYGERIPYGPGDARVHYIRSGRVRVVLHGAGGQDKILAILNRGALVGDDDLVLPSRPSTSCYAAELTETWSWPREFVLDLVRENAEIAVYVLASLTRKLRLLTAQIHGLSFCDAAQRVVRTFVHLAHVYGEPDGSGSARIAIRLTQSEIGEMANASRVTVNKVFRRLKADRLMSKRRGYFVVHDLRRLTGWLAADGLLAGPEPMAGASGQGVGRVAQSGSDDV